MAVDKPREVGDTTTVAKTKFLLTKQETQEILTGQIAQLEVEQSPI